MIIAVSISFYLVLLLALYFSQRKLLYQPAAGYTKKKLLNITFHRAGKTLTGWVVNPEKDNAVIYYGGNNESVEDTIELFEKVLPSHTVYLIPYRGYGCNMAVGSPTEGRLFRDAEFIFDTITHSHDNISLIGHSLGSGVATHIASIKKIDKMILITPYDSIENVAFDHYPIFPMSLIVRDKFLSYKKAPHVKAQTMIVVAGNDKMIKYARTHKLISSFRKGIVSTLIYPHADHGNIGEYSKFRYVGRFFNGIQ